MTKKDLHDEELELVSGGGEPSYIGESDPACENFVYISNNINDMVQMFIRDRREDLINIMCDPGNDVSQLTCKYCKHIYYEDKSVRGMGCVSGYWCSFKEQN